MNIIDDKEENLRKASLMIAQSAAEDVNFIVLPEMFNCPYSNDKFIEYQEEENDSKTLDLISSLASENNFYILSGSIP